MMNTSHIKNQAKQLSLLLCCLSLYAMLPTSCSLDEEPRDQIPEEMAYTTKEALWQNAVATLYNYIGGDKDGQGLQGTCRGVYDLQTFGSDEAMLPTRGGDWFDGGLWQAMYKHSWGPGHEVVKNSWYYLYKVITLCNRSLGIIDAHRDLLTDYEYDRYTAEVHALRAIFYWYLLDLYGNVPLINDTAIPLDQVKQSTRAEVFNFCVNELKTYSDQLSSENSTHEGDYYGRITLPVSFFVLAKLMLNAPVYLGIGTDSPEAAPYYRECAEYCRFIELLGYRLEESYSDCFKVFNHNSCENIFSIPMDDFFYRNHQENIVRSLHYRHAAAFNFTGENGTSATRRVLEIYQYGSPNEDPRFIDNFYADEVYDLDNNQVKDRTGKPLVYYPNEVELDISYSPYKETAGARMKKYEVDKNGTKDGKLVDNDIVLFRYADVLLMRAEALLRLGEDGHQYFDAVRNRSFMPAREYTLQNLLDERLLELCWEGWRRQDLIRFGQYRSLYKGSDAVDESDGHTTVFPIPADVLVFNSNIRQNPGY